MTDLEFKTKLKELNKKLMESVTREQHSKYDNEINILVDNYRKPESDDGLNEANRIALEIAG